MERLKLQCGLFFALCTVWLIQIFVVFPIESRLLDPAVVSVASILFLPSGVKVIFATIMGFRAFIPVVAGTIFGMWIHTGDFWFSAQFSILSSVSLYLPIVALNIFTSNDRLGSVLNDTLVLSLKVLAITVLASFFNSVFGSFIHGDSETVWLHFLMGDLMGAFVVMALLITFRRRVYRLILRRVLPSS